MPPVRPSAGPPGKLAPRGDRRDRGLRHRLPLACGGAPDRVPDHEGFTRPGRRVRRRRIHARFPQGRGLDRDRRPLRRQDRPRPRAHLAGHRGQPPGGPGRGDPPHLAPRQVRLAPHLRGQMKRGSLGEAGVTFLELLLAMVVGLVVLTAVYGVLINQSREYQVHRENVDVAETLKGAATILTSELWHASASRGDLYSIAAQTISLRSFQTAGAFCGAASPRFGVWQPSGSFASTADDSALVFRVTDQTWVRAKVTRSGPTRARPTSRAAPPPPPGPAAARPPRGASSASRPLPPTPSASGWDRRSGASRPRPIPSSSRGARRGSAARSATRRAGMWSPAPSSPPPRTASRSSTTTRPA